MGVYVLFRHVKRNKTECLGWSRTNPLRECLQFHSVLTRGAPWRQQVMETKPQKKGSRIPHHPVEPRQTPLFTPQWSVPTPLYSSLSVEVVNPDSHCSSLLCSLGWACNQVWPVKLKRKSTGTSGKEYALLIKETWVTPLWPSLFPALIGDVMPGATAAILLQRGKGQEPLKDIDPIIIWPSRYSSYPPPEFL